MQQLKDVVFAVWEESGCKGGQEEVNEKEEAEGSHRSAAKSSSDSLFVNVGTGSHLDLDPNIGTEDVDGKQGGDEKQGDAEEQSPDHPESAKDSDNHAKVSRWGCFVCYQWLLECFDNSRRGCVLVVASSCWHLPKLSTYILVAAMVSCSPVFPYLVILPSAC